MRGDWVLPGVAALGMLVIPAAVLLIRGIPLGTLPESESPAQQMQILPGDHTDDDLEALPQFFRILDETTGSVAKVSVLDYVTGAIAAEMPPAYEADALTAQGIAAYTDGVYLARLRRSEPAEGLKGADFSADPGNCRGYLTHEGMKECWGSHYDLYYSKVRAAAETAVQYLLTYGGEPILATYFAISAGMTEDAANVWEGSLPYLVPVESHWDESAAGYRSEVALTEKELKTALAPKGIFLSGKKENWLEVARRSESGYVTAIRAGNVTLKGQEFRTLLGLRSSAFTWEWEDDRITFTVLGYGHGVGLSQYGAQQMALNGSDFTAILQHYYNGVTVEQIS